MAVSDASVEEHPATLLPDRVDLDMQARLAAAYARLSGEAPDASAVRYAYVLRATQESVFESFAEFMRECLAPSEQTTTYGRIVLPPRTGKTVIAGNVIARTGLVTTFVTNTLTLAEQAIRDFCEQLPETLVGAFTGEREHVVPFGVNVTTYGMMQSRWKNGRIPEPIRSSALVIVDEAHHAMTKSRVDFIRDAFDPFALRVALTATPNYDERRVLAHHYPELIHELTLLEAVEMNMLAPLRVWVAEVDVDASDVQIVNGDYQEAVLSRIMSEAPFFKAAETFRYSEEHRRLPALITCTTRQQAYDCVRYLDAHRPRFASSPALILGETPDRERILERFEKDVIDTIVSVKALIEGWDSARCKLLIDLSPSLSLVMATQKFCRVLTRDGDREAHIVMIVPAGLARSPIMPMELLAPALEEYETGEIVDTPEPGVASKPKKLKRHPRKHPVRDVRLKSRIVLEHRVERPLLDPKDQNQVRAVLASHAWFSPERPCTYKRFRSLMFRHRLFTGRADHLMRHLGHQPRYTDYQQILARYCPDGVANALLADALPVAMEDDGADRQWLRQQILSGTPRTENERRKFEEACYALGMPDMGSMRTPEDIVYQHERLIALRYAMGFLSTASRRVVSLRMGLEGGEEMTFEQIGEALGYSVSATHTAFRRALAEFRRRVPPP